MEPIYRLIGAKLTRGSIANIELGKQRILLHDVQRFSDAFGISPKVLLRGIWC